MTDDIEARIEAETTRGIRRVSLREAAKRVSKIRAELGNIARLPELPDDLAKEARRLHDNGVENLLWHIEQRITAKVDD